MIFDYGNTWGLHFAGVIPVVVLQDFESCVGELGVALCWYDSRRH